MNTDRLLFVLDIVIFMCMLASALSGNIALTVFFAAALLYKN